MRGDEGKPLLHLWAENCNVTRRVLAIADQSDARLALAVERFGRVKPERLEMVRLEFVPTGSGFRRCNDSRIRATREVVLRFRGLAFARWQDDRIFFDVHGLWQELNARTELPLKQLLLNLQNFRNLLASDSRHPLYRSQSERWLQSLVAQDLSRVDINLHPDLLYEQVFAQSASQRGVLDLLAVTRSGRPAILELKAAENVDLPRQAADYWSRIRHHQQAGDFVRYGYFPGLQLSSAAPIVYLISPALHFHPSTDIILRYLSPEIEVIRIGVAESWRRGICVVMRQ